MQMSYRNYSKHLDKYYSEYKKYKKSSISLFKRAANSYMMYLETVPGDNSVDISHNSVREWIKHMEKKGHKFNTRKTYYRHVKNHFMPFLKHMEMLAFYHDKQESLAVLVVPPQPQPQPENQVVVHNKCREGRGMQKPNQPLRRGGNIDVVEETDESEEPTHNLFVILLFLIEIYMFLQLIM